MKENLKLNEIYFYEIGYGHCEGSYYITLYSDEKLNDYQLKRRFFKAIRESLDNNKVKDFKNNVIDQIKYYNKKKKKKFYKPTIRIEDIINYHQDTIFKTLEKYNLYKIKIENRLSFFGWSSTCNIWKYESNPHDITLIKILRKYINRICEKLKFEKIY